MTELKGDDVPRALDLLLAKKSYHGSSQLLLQEVIKHSKCDQLIFSQSVLQVIFALSHEHFAFPQNCLYDSRQAFVFLMQFCYQETHDKNDRMMQVPARKRAEEGYMTCRCGSKRIEWEDRHIRSADEGATLFCVCTDCGARWRISA